ncbi:MAG: hypothetical protein EXS00_00950 [Phycisphaerales bacterium]|nr:hypothetical protein [Phycisphaerales bacterium]
MVESSPQCAQPAIRGLLIQGLRASGKTTLGALLAVRLGWDFADLDQVAATRVGCESAGAALRLLGEPAWREAEDAALEGLLGEMPHAPAPSGGLRCGAGDARRVIALGGGTPTHPRAAARLQSARAAGWRIIWLECSLDVLRQRLRSSPVDRPALTPMPIDEELVYLHRSRGPHYLRLADLRLDVSALTPEAAVEALLPLLEG